MKILKYSASCLILTMLIISCADEPLPFEQGGQDETIVYAKELSNDGGEYLFANPDNSTFTFEVEYVSQNDESGIKAHEWFVYYRSDSTGQLSDTVLIESVPSSSFGINPSSGLPSNTFTFALNDVFAALEITIDSVRGGDDFFFDGEIVLNDDSRFGPKNLSPFVGNDTTLFRIVKSLRCPSNLEGTYNSFTEGESTDACCPDKATLEGEVFLEEVERGVYSINDWSVGLYRFWYEDDSITQKYIDEGNMKAIFTDDCNSITSDLVVEPFGETLEISGMVIDVEEGKIEYRWTNGWGDEATVSLTRKE